MSVVKKDLLTGEDIILKTKEYADATFYSNRRNLTKHFREISPKLAVDITAKIIFDRIKRKKIKNSPSTVECKSYPFPCPSPALIQSLDLNYNIICGNLNLNCKYKYSCDLRLKKELTKNIIVDSREQKAFKFPCQTKVLGLKFADYKSEDNDEIAIERKSGQDFISTMSQGFERFCRELSKAQKANCNIVMVVESKLSDMLSFNYLPQYKWSKASPAFIFSRLRTLLQEFDNFQAVFCDNIQDATNITHLLLTNPHLFEYDIQYLKDLKLIK